MDDSLNVKPKVASFKYFRQICLLNTSRDQNNKSFVSLWDRLVRSSNPSCTSAAGVEQMGPREATWNLQAVNARQLLSGVPSWLCTLAAPI